MGSHRHPVEQKTAVHRGDRATQVSALLESDLFGSVSCAAGLATAEKGGLRKKVILTRKQSRVSGNSISIGVFFVARKTGMGTGNKFRGVKC